MTHMQDKQVTLEFQNVSGWVPKGFAAPGILPKFSTHAPKKEDLKQVRSCAGV